MKASELIKLLRKNKDQEIIIKVEDGLYYPIKEVKTYDGRVIIIAKDIHNSVEMSSFGPLSFNDSVEYLLITEQEK